MNPYRTEGTYSKYASLDDKLDGFHYYLMFIKFGIGRATSDSAHEVRDKKISREEHEQSSLSSYGVPFEKFDVNKDQYISWKEYKNQLEDSHNIGGKKV